MNKVLSVIAACSLTAAAVGTSVVGTPTARAADVARLTSTPPATIPLERGPSDIISWELVLAVVVVPLVYEYFFGSCLTAGPAVDLASDAAFDVAR